MIAVGWAVVGPQLLYVSRPVVGDRIFNSVGHADGLVSLLFTGGYPAVTWVPFVIGGMAVARLDLAVASYGGSWLALRLVPGAADAIPRPETGSSTSSMSSLSSPPGTDGAFGDSPFGLLVASPHSETTLSIVLTVCLDTYSMITGRGYVLLGFIVSITVLAMIWSRFFRQGPLEWLLSRATRLAQRVR